MVLEKSHFVKVFGNQGAAEPTAETGFTQLCITRHQTPIQLTWVRLNDGPNLSLIPPNRRQFIGINHDG